MKTIKSCYYKLTYQQGQEGVRLISGLPLPDPAKGPYEFVSCRFHPAVQNELEQNYVGSRFEDCSGLSYWAFERLNKKALIESLLKEIRID